MIEVSIVSGTYNRLPYLKRMVESVRGSIGVGIHYEVVIVDGGSADGTIEWCKDQFDIKFIQQGKLLGAVKAFNAGARAASGRYVILANDDIEFLDFSILSAISFMQDDPQIGIGCFWQDRRGDDFHVEEMSVVRNGVQSTGFYGQVCIVPKFLGDMVGWWGNYLYTYGGDNELSCNVYELGYKILPIPCAYIHDATPKDELRSVNNDKMLVHGSHPDTAAWVKKWTRNGLQGPNVGSRSFIGAPVKRLDRFFYMPIYEPGHMVQKSTKHGMRDALAKVGLVVECDYLAMPHDDILDLSCAIDANIFITQFHGADPRHVNLFHELKNQHPGAIFVNWNGDYHPEYLVKKSYVNFMKEFDYVGVVTTAIKDTYNAAGVNWFYWQIGFEEHKSTKFSKMPTHDVVFMANGYSKARVDLASKLREMRGVDVGIYGSWPGNIRANGNTLYDFDRGAALYKSSKIAIGDSQWPHAAGFVSNRLFQALAAGAFLMHQEFDGMEELLGLKDGEHLVVWNTWEGLREKIDYYLARPDLRRRISKSGEEFVRKNHSFDHRVGELLERIHA